MTFTDPTNVAVTLSSDLYRELRRESRRLGIPMEWLVASLVVDTVDRDGAKSSVLAA